jgi:hypothetical protein
VFSAPISAETPSEDVTHWAEGISKRFVPQPATWEDHFSIDQLSSIYGTDEFRKMTPEKIADETKLFLGPDGCFYRSESGYKRYHGIFENSK